MITMTRESVSMPNDFIRRRILACMPFRSNRPVRKSNNRPVINVTSVPVIGVSRMDSPSFSLFSIELLGKNCRRNWFWTIDDRNYR